MSVNPLNLTISLAKNSSCTSVLLQDDTGTVGVDGNTDGYGISGGPTVNNVDTLTIAATYNSMATTITYVFTISSGTVTACTLSIQGGTPADIFADLDPDNLTFPFTSDNPFDLFADYGVAIPEFIDDVYTVDYTIEGTASGGDFEFETSDELAVTCIAQLCVNQKFAALDWSCECASDKAKQAMAGQAYINQIVAATALGDLTSALNALERVNRLCDTASGGCNC